MEELLLCIHTIGESSLDDLRESVLAKEVGVLNYATIILGPTFEEAQDILQQNQLKFLSKYGAGLPVLDLHPFAEKVNVDGKMEYYAFIPAIYKLDEANQLWSSSIITSARLSFNEWLVSSDVSLDIQSDRACDMLRRCMNQAKLFLDSGVDGAKPKTSFSRRKKVEYKHYQSRADRLLALDAVAQIIIAAALANREIPTFISMAEDVKKKGIWKRSLGRLQNILTATGTPVLHRLLKRAKERPDDTASKKYREWREKFERAASLCRASLVQRHDDGLTDEDRTVRTEVEKEKAPPNRSRIKKKKTTEKSRFKKSHNILPPQPCRQPP